MCRAAVDFLSCFCPQMTCVSHPSLAHLSLSLSVCNCSWSLCVCDVIDAALIAFITHTLMQLHLLSPDERWTNSWKLCLLKFSEPLMDRQTDAAFHLLFLEMSCGVSQEWKFCVCHTGTSLGLCVCVCVCVCVYRFIWFKYEDTNVYNDMGTTM